MNLLAQHWAEVWIPGSVGLILTGAPICFLLRLIFLGFASRNWPTVPGKVIEARHIERRPSNRVLHGFARITVEYEIEGRLYRTTNLRYGHGIEANTLLAKDLIEAHPEGTEVNVHVRGKEAVLLPGPSGWLFIYVPLCLFVFGAILYGLITRS